MHRPLLVTDARRHRRRRGERNRCRLSQLGNDMGGLVDGIVDECGLVGIAFERASADRSIDPIVVAIVAHDRPPSAISHTIIRRPRSERPRMLID
jgi:hypothetical protein